MRRTALLGTALLTLAACSEAGTPLAPADDTGADAALAIGSPPTGRIMFTAWGGDGLDLFIVNPDGTGLTSFATLAGNELQPAWSWDNQWVAFLRPRADAASVEHNELYVVDQNGGNGHWVTPSPLGVDLRDPAWSPDGTRITLTTDNLALLSIDVATGTVQTLPYTGGAPSYDPTGQLVVYSTGVQLQVAKADGSGLVSVIPAPSSHGLQYPKFSPDGKKIAFGAYNLRDDSDIWLVNADGTGLVRLVGGPTLDTEPTWSPDGQTIAYASNKKGRWEIWRVSVAGGHRIKVTSTSGFAPAWTH
jgi:Tol biopolymer transport system component